MYKRFFLAVYIRSGVTLLGLQTPANLCQNLIEGLILSIQALPCPVGFNLSQGDSKCICATALKKLGIQNCYIDSKSGNSWLHCDSSLNRTKTGMVWHKIVVVIKYLCALRTQLHHQPPPPNLQYLPTPKYVDNKQ
jgi:hypothetical protein